MISVGLNQFLQVKKYKIKYYAKILETIFKNQIRKKTIRGSVAKPFTQFPGLDLNQGKFNLSRSHATDCVIWQDSARFAEPMNVGVTVNYHACHVLCF